MVMLARTIVIVLWLSFLKKDTGYIVEVGVSDTRESLGGTKWHQTEAQRALVDILFSPHREMAKEYFTCWR